MEAKDPQRQTFLEQSRELSQLPLLQVTSARGWSMIMAAPAKHLTFKPENIQPTIVTGHAVVNPLN